MPRSSHQGASNGGGILAAVFGLQFLGPGEWILAHLVLVPAEILSGRQLWTLFTAIFLHGNILHLLGNVYVLFVFGDNVEDYLGGPRFLALFFVAGLTGSLLQTVFQVPRDVPNLGASGAIAGVMAAYVVIFPKVKVYQMVRPFRFRLGVLWFIGFWLLWNLLPISKTADPLAAECRAQLRPTPVPHRRSRRHRP